MRFYNHLVSVLQIVLTAVIVYLMILGLAKLKSM